MRVEATFSAEKIEAVRIAAQKETMGIGSVAVERLPDAIVKAQPGKINALSGGGVTSKAILEAVRAV